MILDVLEEEDILTDLKATDRDGVLAELTDHLVWRSIIANPKAVLSELLEREKLDSTGIEEGIAIPHIRTDEVRKITLCIGISKEGIPFQSMDGSPTKLFFLILAPKEKSSQHLKMLAALSRLTAKKSTVKSILSAKTAKELMDIIKREESD